MAANFNTDTHCTTEIQIAVGLRKAHCDLPRIGDKTCPGDMSHDMNSCWCVQDSFTTQGATTLWNTIPQATKNQPPNAHVAYQLCLLAKIAGQDATPRMRHFVPNFDRANFGKTFYVAPGSALFEGFRASHRFIAFLFVNMDDVARVKWYNMTGREQYEWYRAWERAGRTHTRVTNETDGLKGTDLARITTQAELTAAMIRSPSLGRRHRPNGHAIIQADWDETVQRLFD